MSSAVIGLLLLLLGAGGFTLTMSLSCLVPTCVGICLALMGRRLMATKTVGTLLGTALAVSTVTMIFTASALPRLIRLLTGSEVDRSGDIFVIGSTAVLCLIHVTLTLRLLIRSGRSI